MADRTTIARPYAKAAFRRANADARLGPWADVLATAAQTVTDLRVKPLLGSPLTTPAELAQLVIEVAGDGIDDAGRNFLRTLAENHRLGYLPEIAVLFSRYKDEAEGCIDVDVTSATLLSEAEAAELSKALAKRLNRRVRLHPKVDPDLLGGAVLRAGDLVIDGSMKTRLERLAFDLTA